MDFKLFKVKFGDFGIFRRESQSNRYNLYYLPTGQFLSGGYTFENAILRAKEYASGDPTPETMYGREIAPTGYTTLSPSAYGGSWKGMRGFFMEDLSGLRADSMKSYPTLREMERERKSAEEDEVLRRNE